MEIPVIPPDDAGAVFLPEFDLPLTDHALSPCNRPAHRCGCLVAIAAPRSAA
jgi:hypothetical protein